MDPNQPKRRGRKKKVVETVPNAVIPTEKAYTPSPVLSVEEKAVSRIRVSKEHVQERLNEASIILEELVKPESIVDAIHERAVKRVMGWATFGEEGLNLRSQETYKRVKCSSASRQEVLEWQNQISTEMARRICRCLDFLLQNGPANKIEANLLNCCSTALKSYYVERSYLISINKDVYTSSTYFPIEGSCIYKYLTEVLEIPPLEDLTGLYDGS